MWGLCARQAERFAIGEARVVQSHIKIVCLYVAGGATHQRVGVVAEIAAQTFIVKEAPSQFNTLNGERIIVRNVQICGKIARNWEGIRGGREGNFGWFGVASKKTTGRKQEAEQVKNMFFLFHF